MSGRWMRVVGIAALLLVMGSTGSHARSGPASSEPGPDGPPLTVSASAHIGEVVTISGDGCRGVVSFAVLPPEGDHVVVWDAFDAAGSWSRALTITRGDFVPGFHTVRASCAPSFVRCGGYAGYGGHGGYSGCGVFDYQPSKFFVAGVRTTIAAQRAGALFQVTVATADPADVPTGVISLSVDGGQTHLSHTTLAAGKAELPDPRRPGTTSDVELSFTGLDDYADATLILAGDTAPKAVSTTTLARDGDVVVATVTSPFEVPEGTVTFTIDGVDHAPVPLAAGRAAVAAPGTAGRHTVRAAYAGSATHDPSQSALLTYDVATPPAPAPGPTAPAPVDRTSGGYRLVSSDGGVFAFGNAGWFGSTGNIRLNSPIVGTAPTPTGNGYWLVASDGGIFAFGDAPFHGSTGNIRLNSPIVAQVRTPSGNGYWLVASDGGIFAFGDAPFHGSTGNIRLNKPIVAAASTPTGNGYWLIASDGGIFAFGDAPFHGSTGNIRLNKPIVAAASTPTGNGYWLIASDGGVFAFGDAAFHGRPPGTVSSPIVAASVSQRGAGYWMAAADGGLYAFGDATYHGSAINLPLRSPIVAISPTR